MIRQARFSKSIIFFEKGFLERWHIDRYNNINLPALFLGVYRMEDVVAINKHKGLKIVWHPGGVKDLFMRLDHSNMIVAVGKGVDFVIPERYNMRRIDIPIKDFIQLKDFSMYKPVPLGKKIYAYLGKDKNATKKKLGYDLIREIDKIVPFVIIEGYQGHTAKFIIHEYYKNSFINIKPSLTGGLTTAIEMAYMGRKTISNAIGPFCYGYENIDDIVSLIMKESKRIGQMPKALVNDDFFLGDEWKKVKYWI